MSFSLLAYLLLAGAPVMAAVINVAAGQSIQTAIDSANTADTVLIAAGTFNERITVNKSITIQGTESGFGGLPATSIDGQDGGSVITVTAGGPTFQMLDIQGGRAEKGGGARITSGASARFADCRFLGNEATADGGGIYFLEGNITITHCVFLNNSAVGSGGGIYCIQSLSSSATITDNLIRDNTADMAGGAVLRCYTNSALVFSGNSVASNEATTYAAGLYVDVQGKTLENNVIEDNNALPSGLGGGLYLFECDNVTLRGNIIRRNQARSAGGVGIMGDESATLICNQITGNSVTNEGGGLRALHLDGLELWNNTISDNSAEDGGAVYLYNVNGPVFHNNIFAFNTGYGLDKLSTYPEPDFGYNCFHNNTPEHLSGFVNPLGANGNFTGDPLFANRGSGDYHLKSAAGRWNGSAWVEDARTSPCIDQGNPTTLLGNESDPNGGRANIGRYGTTDEASRSSVFAAVSPLKGNNDAPRRREITVNFPWPVKMGSAESKFSLVKVSTGNAVAGVIDWPIAARKLRFTPSSPLARKARFEIRLAAGVKRVDGTSTNYACVSPFRTGDRPVVKSAMPTGTGVKRGENLVINFDQAMQAGWTATDLVLKPAVAGVCTWSNADRTLTFNPDSNLLANRRYTVTVGAGARTAAGTTMKYPYEWSFETGATVAAVSLAAAAAPAGGGAVTLTLQLSEAAAVGGCLTNLAGREVAFIPERQLPAGSSTIIWQARSAQGTALPRGTYLLKLVARGADGPQAVALTALCLDTR